MNVRKEIWPSGLYLPMAKFHYKNGLISELLQEYKEIKMLVHDPWQGEELTVQDYLWAGTHIQAAISLKMSFDAIKEVASSVELMTLDLVQQARHLMLLRRFATSSTSERAYEWSHNPELRKQHTVVALVRNTISELPAAAVKLLTSASNPYKALVMCKLDPSNQSAMAEMKALLRTMPDIALSPTLTVTPKDLEAAVASR